MAKVRASTTVQEAIIADIDRDNEYLLSGYRYGVKQASAMM